MRIYKRAVSPLIPKACRFIPSCSEYGALAFERFPPCQAATSPRALALSDSNYLCN